MLTCRIRSYKDVQDEVMCQRMGMWRSREIHSVKTTEKMVNKNYNHPDVTLVDRAAKEWMLSICWCLGLGAW